MELKINELKLRNFKGQRDFVLCPTDEVTSVHGTNATGKSTICDSWVWLWTGKDMKDRADYEIKTKVNGMIQHELEHAVSASIDVDGVSYGVERIYEENWVKPTGEKERVLKAHTTRFVWDTIPLSKKAEFDMRVDHLFGDTETFKLLSNPRYFLTIDWKKRRKLLMELAAVTDESIMKQLARSSEDFAHLLSEIKNNSLEDFRKKLNADKKVLQKQIDEIPVKIREATLAIPVEPDYAEVEREIKENEAAIASIDEQMNDITKSFEAQMQSVKASQRIILEKETLCGQMENEARLIANRLNSDENKKLSELQEELAKVEATIRFLFTEQATIINRVHNKESEIESQNNLLLRFRGEYMRLNELVFDENKAICPSCKQGLPANDVMEIMKKFNADKENQLEDNIRKGKGEKETIALLSNQLKELTEQKDAIAKKIEERTEEKAGIESKIQAELGREKVCHSHIEMLKENEDYQILLSEIEVLKSSLGETKSPDISELQAKKAEINRTIRALSDDLSVRKIADNQRKRIKDLEAELKVLAQELTTLEGKEFIADKFNKARIEAIEQGINGLFATIKWKMFKPLLNGGEDECCEAILSCGNIYDAANNAGQINAGIECINTLSVFYNMYLPIFIDNAESIVELTPSRSQIIRFVVNENHKVLTIKQKSNGTKKSSSGTTAAIAAEEHYR